MLSASALSFAVPSLRTSAAYAGSPSSVRFVSRTYTPFDPNEKAAYGMGAAEKFSYDPEHAYAYVATDRGYISVIDYSAPVASVTSASAWVRASLHGTCACAARACTLSSAPSASARSPARSSPSAG